jgi:hypothetical protein
MSKIDNLRQAYDAVKAGVRHFTFPSVFGTKRLGRKAYSAHHGSINAAFDLHSEVMRGRSWDVWRTAALGFDPKKYGCNIPGVDTEYAETPSRAWLLAILAALIAIEEGGA